MTGFSGVYDFGTWFAVESGPADGNVELSDVGQNCDTETTQNPVLYCIVSYQKWEAQIAASVHDRTERGENQGMSESAYVKALFLVNVYSVQIWGKTPQQYGKQ